MINILGIKFIGLLLALIPPLILIFVLSPKYSLSFHLSITLANEVKWEITFWFTLALWLWTTFLHFECVLDSDYDAC